MIARSGRGLLTTSRGRNKERRQASHKQSKMLQTPSPELSSTSCNYLNCKVSVLLFFWVTLVACLLIPLLCGASGSHHMPNDSSRTERPLTDRYAALGWLALAAIAIIIWLARPFVMGIL